MIAFSRISSDGVLLLCRYSDAVALLHGPPCHRRSERDMEEGGEISWGAGEGLGWGEEGRSYVMLYVILLTRTASSP